MFECINCGSHHQRDNDPEFCCFRCYLAWCGEDPASVDPSHDSYSPLPLGVPAVQQPLSPTQIAARDKYHDQQIDDLPF